MIEDGRAYGSYIATRHLLKLLVRKGLISRNDVTNLHDDAQDELRAILKRGGMDPEGGADAARAIGSLYLLD